MIRVENPEKCCGCGNCKIVCPVQVVSIVEDAFGFTKPQVDIEKCINCGLCEKRCPVINHINSEDLDHDVYVAFSKDSKTRFLGSSGGMFGSVAQKMFSENNKNQLVYGAAFDKDLKLKLTVANTESELTSLYKSKYLQSDLGDEFPKIKQKLEEGINVLFTATPCQVYALKLFLGKDYDNLTTIDFICHGVPSQSFFDKCKEYVENKDKIKIINYQFRAKKKGGSTPHYYKIDFVKYNKSFTKTKLYTKSPYYLGFQKYITLRDSCYNCQFSASNRCSDITIGDFHDVDKYLSGINRFEGVSVFITNTPKGKGVWEKIKDSLEYHKFDIKQLVRDKVIFAGGTKKPINRDSFINDLKEKPFEYVVNKYLNSKKEWKKDIYYALPRFIRDKIKKILGV